MQIAIADSHVIFSESLRSYLIHADPQAQVFCSADYGELVRTLNEQSVDMLLLDPSLPGLPMMDHFAEIDMSHPEMRMGLLVRDLEDAAHVEANGIHGVFPKNISSKLLMQGMQQVINGDTFFPDIQNTVFYHEDPQAYDEHKKVGDFHLTQRESEVMVFLMKGATNKDVARALDLQVVTVKLHVRGICRKMGAKNRTQAALLAKEAGWE